jgi:dTDP-4-dehydrorhamnose reductase
MKRIAVTGLTGQVVSSLIERAPRGVEMLALGRPRFDLSSRDMVLASLRSVRCDAIVNAAAYTQVDKAESEPDVAMRVNGAGAGFVAETAAELNVPLLHLSTDYVFDGTLDRPYREDDAPGPTGAYGRSKLEGEKQIAARCENSVILRTAWVYSPFGANFVKTRCCVLARPAMKSALSPIRSAIQRARSTSPTRCSPSPKGWSTIPIRVCAAFST